jgi:imidazole glycerol-phosphate synthase subunit HisF
MLRTRIIPVLLLKNQSLVKTKTFGAFQYIGDPCNTVKIFNELEVDELCFLDITCSLEKREPNFDLLEDIASECFMPLSYGGGVQNFEQAARILRSGYEKIIINHTAISNPTLMQQIADAFGSQALVGSIDVKKNILGSHRVYDHVNRRILSELPQQWAQRMVHYGAGEILLTSVDNEGTWKGYDLDLVNSVSQSVPVPVIAHGGAGQLNDFNLAKAAVATGSLVVFQKQGCGVLVNFPEPYQVDQIFT